MTEHGATADRGASGDVACPDDRRPRAARSRSSRAAGAWRCASSSTTGSRWSGSAVLVFFVLFCFLGPLFYHTNQIAGQPARSPTWPPGDGHLLGTDEQRLRRARPDHGRGADGARDRLLRRADRDGDRHALGRDRRACRAASSTAFMMRIVDMLLSIPLLFIVLVLATKYSATVLDAEPADRPVLVARSRRASCGARCSPCATRDFVSAARVMGAAARGLSSGT